jgi:hypothetical protein
VRERSLHDHVRAVAYRLGRTRDRDFRFVAR